MNQIKKTNDTVTDIQLAEIIGLDDDDPEMELGNVIQVCAGEWRKEGFDTWRFWEYSE